MRIAHGLVKTVLRAKAEAWDALGSGVALAAPVCHIARWADGRMHELRAYLDGDHARSDYERLGTQNA